MIEWILAIPVVSIYSIVVYFRYNKILNRNKKLQKMLKEEIERKNKLEGDNNKLKRGLSRVMGEGNRSKEDFDHLKSKFGEERGRLQKELSGAINKNIVLEEELSDLHLRIDKIDKVVNTVQKELGGAVKERSKLKEDNERLQRELSEAVKERGRLQVEWGDSYPKIQKKLIELYARVDKVVNTVQETLNEKEETKGEEKYEYGKISVKTRQ